MEKINLLEVLRNCPEGMELDCTIYENTYFGGLTEDESDEYPIIVNICNDRCEHNMYLTKEGYWTSHSEAKCVIFPKGKTTWEGFQRPFKDGDIAVSNDGLFIGIVKYVDENCIYTYCAINKVGNLTKNCPYYLHRFATEEEKGKLFDAIKDNGYKWNAENKTLEKMGYKYPKTYEECCDILQLEHTFELKDLTIDEEKLTDSFIRLKRCRDAYWKIAGEQMGLGKPWEFKLGSDSKEVVYTISVFGTGIMLDFYYALNCNKILVFSTEEMRDAFYENFKDLIEECKELL